MEPIKITSKSHIIISGGAGFIGSHLSRRLLNLGAKVTILTRHTHSPQAVQLEREGATILPCDVTSLMATSIHNDLCGADVFYHLAADVAISSSKTWETNVVGTQRALNFAEAAQIPYVVFASSIEAQGLGSEDEIPLGEQMPCRPVSEYGASKAKAEELALAWSRESGRHVLVFRIGNIYGPGSAWLMQPSLMALSGVSSLAGVWSQLEHRVLQPLYIDDLIEGMLSAAGRRLTGLYNITGEQPVTVGGYLRSLADLLQLSERTDVLQMPSGEETSPTLSPDFAYLLMGRPNRCHRSYDNTRLRSCIGPYARWPLARGLASTLRWFQQSDLWPALLNMARRRTGDGVCMSR
ncbi:MAG: NAD(P)-dependent oxidoreductase [Nitrospira sp.]|nr:NAD(P)-dependent oxidoreductase [Nitrospira sp.]